MCDRHNKNVKSSSVNIVYYIINLFCEYLSPRRCTLSSYVVSVNSAEHVRVDC